jgi:ABC-2 type transport system permease protein
LVQWLPLFSQPANAYVLLDSLASPSARSVGYRAYALVYPVRLGTLCAFGGYLIFRRSDLS